MLHQFDWVLYMDADVVITNSEYSLDALIHVMVTREPAAYLVVQDGVEINSGVLLFRRGQQSQDFLSLWWALGTHTVRVDRTDQAALMLAILDTALRASTALKGFGYPHTVSHCVSTPHYWQFVWRWNAAMALLGSPLTQRAVDGIAFLFDDVSIVDAVDRGVNLRCFPSNAVAQYQLTTVLHKRRLQALFPQLSVCRARLQDSGVLTSFNSINAVGNNDLAVGLHPSQLWRLGNFAVHVTQSPELPALYSQFTQFLVDLNSSRCFHGQHWKVIPKCIHPPCLDDLWLNAYEPRFVMVNRWHEYSPQKPDPMLLVSHKENDIPQWWSACTVPHYSVSFALEMSQEYPGALSGHRRRLHVYRVVDFHVGLDDDLVSRLFDFASLYSHDWLHFIGIMESMAASPAVFQCMAPTATCTWGVRFEIANESLLNVQTKLDALQTWQRRPVVRLTSTHIDWT